MSSDPRDDPSDGDPLAAASGLDAGEEDPDPAATAALPGHGADERVDEEPSGAAQQPSIGPPSQDH